MQQLDNREQAGATRLSQLGGKMRISDLDKAFKEPKIDPYYYEIKNWWEDRKEEIRRAKQMVPPFNYPTYFILGDKLFLVCNIFLRIKKIINEKNVLCILHQEIVRKGESFYHIDSKNGLLKDVYINFLHINASSSYDFDILSLRRVCLGSLKSPHITSKQELEEFHYKTLVPTLEVLNFYSPLNIDAIKIGEYVEFFEHKKEEKQ